MRITRIVSALALVVTLTMASSASAGKYGTAPSKDIVDTAVAAGNFKTLAAALQAAGLIEALKAAGPFTVFAPTDEAFAKLPAGTLESLLKPENKDKLAAILKYHVVSGKVMSAQAVKLSSATTLEGSALKLEVKDGALFVSGAKVVKADIEASNGVIHVIDSVVLPPAAKDIVDTAVAAGSFKTLAAALQAAGLIEALKTAGPFTVFAPTDEAFAKLPAGTLDSLLKPENKNKLAAILKYHVVPGKVMSAQAVKLSSATTLEGSALKLEVKDGALFVSGAKVVKADVEASNGVIHVIDSVVLPPAK